MNNDDVRRHLSGDRLHIFVATAMGLAFAVYAGLFAVGYGGNPVKSLMILVGVAAMVIASLRPRIGLRLLVFTSAYLDFVKRLLLCFGMSSMSDVTGVLAVAPMILMGIFLGTCVLRPIFTKKMLTPEERRLVWGGMLVVGAAAAIGFRDATWIGDFLGNVANQGAYSLLVPVAFILFRREDPEEIRRFLRFTAYVYIPVAIYGVFQFWFGYNQLEIDYLRSGLTVTSINLYDLHPRPFSTMNSPHSFSVLMWFMAVCTVHLGFRKTANNRTPRWLPLLYIGSVFFSFVRGAIVLTVANLFMARWFRTRKGTMIFYGVAICTFAVLVSFSQQIVDNLEYFQKHLPGEKDWQQVLFRLGTLSDRFFGYQGVLLNPRMYTLFGHGGGSYSSLEIKAGEEGYNHDSLSIIIYRFGIFGLLITLSLATYIMYRVHSVVWKTKDPARKALGTSLVSMFTLIVLSHVGGVSYNVYPINLFMWLFLGLALAACTGQAHTEAELTAETQIPRYSARRRGTRRGAEQPLRLPRTQ